ncbi:MAG TPA: helix-turn-helix domain-containing protein [Stellaceae bacterium]|nr:helix-turn-helix domain-containing protein [Stellaceae bacterium]
MAGDGSLALIEAGIRGGAVTLLAVLAVLLLRDARRAPAGLYGALFALSGIGYVISSAPELVYHAPALWLAPARLASFGAPAVFWLFARASFDDAFTPSWRDAAPWLLTVGMGVLCARRLLPLVCALYSVLQLTLLALAIRQAIVGRAADLIEERRKFRVVLCLTAAVYTSFVVLLDWIMRGPPAAPPGTIISATGLLALTLAFVIARLTLMPSAEFTPAAAAAPVSATQVPPPVETPMAADDAQERALLEPLRRLMEDDKVYREEGLSIAVLAAKLAVPEYRLRRLINQRLGHRNFSSFVNGYRLADAMAALADRSQDEVPIVTIALDAGFQSLGPFNRAFKAHTGMTPTDYRRQGGNGARRLLAPTLADSEIGQPL